MVSTARNLHRYVEYTMYNMYDIIFIIKRGAIFVRKYSKKFIYIYICRNSSLYDSSVYVKFADMILAN